jgi:hypothetical protein
LLNSSLASSILYKGDIIQNISVGGYVKIKKDFEEIIGKIEGELIKTLFIKLTSKEFIYFFKIIFLFSE